MHSHHYEAIVLKTYDVGEADRFCILLTREAGRLAARARGVRKLTSRMGGALLPFQHVQVELKELGNEGWLVISARRNLSCVDHSRPTMSQSIPLQILHAFSQVQQGSELLLKLLHSHQPLPDVFDATLQFLRLCHDGHRHLILGFTLHLLNVLGHLPESSNHVYFASCSQEEKNFLMQAREGRYEHFSKQNSCPLHSTLQAIADVLIADQISSPLRAGRVFF